MATYLENFNKTASTQLPTLDANWVRVKGSVDCFRTDSNGRIGAVAATTSNVLQTYRYAGLSTSATDCSASLTIKGSGSTNDVMVGPAVRVDGTGANQYYAVCRLSSGVRAIRVVKVVATSATTLHDFDGTDNYRDGDVVELRAVGTDLICSVNGNAIYTGTGVATDISSGGVGVAMSTNTSNAFTMDNWVGNDAYSAAPTFVCQQEVGTSGTSLVVPGGSNRVTVAFVYSQQPTAAASVSALTWNSVSANYIGRIQGGTASSYRNVELWYWKDSELTTAASGAVSWSFSNAPTVSYVVMVTFSGRAQTSIAANFATAPGSPSDGATSVAPAWTAAATDCGAMGAIVGTTAALPAFDNSWIDVVRATASSSCYMAGIKDALSAGTYTETMSWSGGSKTAGIGVSLAQASSATAVPVFMNQYRQRAA